MQTVVEWEDHVVKHAAYFTCCFKRGIGEVRRREFPTLREAIEYRGDSPRGMVYAVTADEHSIMLSPKDYERFLTIRGEGSSVLERKDSERNPD